MQWTSPIPCQENWTGNETNSEANEYHCVKHLSKRGHFQCSKVIRARYIILPHNGKLSREKTFANLAVLWQFVSFLLGT